MLYKLVSIVVAGSLVISSASCVQRASSSKEGVKQMEYGAFSISLAVKDISQSKNFYEKLGFTVVMGEAKQNWLILRNGQTTIGLFQGMFEKNTMTFNPGWDANATKLNEFTDVRVLQRRFKSQGIAIVKEADEKSSGPASFLVVDPDGNPILFDQHI
jgi:lactoylglutathione lyase